MPSGQRARRYKPGATGFKGEDKLQFEINGQEYFLNFIEDEQRWFVLAPSETGVNRIPVYVDGSYDESARQESAIAELSGVAAGRAKAGLHFARFAAAG